MIGEVADVTTAVAAALTASRDSRRPATGKASGCLTPLRAYGRGSVSGIVNLLGLQPAFRFAALEDTEAAMKAAAWTFGIVKEFAEDLSRMAKDGSSTSPPWMANSDLARRI